MKGVKNEIIYSFTINKPIINVDALLF